MSDEQRRDDDVPDVEGHYRAKRDEGVPTEDDAEGFRGRYRSDEDDDGPDVEGHIRGR